MKAIILLGGYATRLYPITLNMPKALLTVGGQTLMDHLFEKLDKVEAIDEAILLSNDKFYYQFQQWTKKYTGPKKITLINDNDNPDRSCIIANLIYTIKTCKVKDDIMVLAGDHYFKFELTEFYNFFKEKDNDCCIGDIIEDKIYLKQFGVGTVDEDNVLLEMEEKPEEPKSNNRILAFYIYKKSSLPMLEKYKKEGNSTPSPGKYLAWLYKNKPVHVFLTNKECHDIGTIPVYEALDKRVTEEVKKNKK